MQVYWSKTRVWKKKLCYTDKDIFVVYVKYEVVYTNLPGDVQEKIGTQSLTFYNHCLIEIIVAQKLKEQLGYRILKSKM